MTKATATPEVQLEVVGNQIPEVKIANRISITNQENVVANIVYSIFQQMRFDHPLQREEVWKDEQVDNLFYGILKGYKIPPVFVQKDGDTLWSIDGKNRILKLIGYIAGRFALSKNARTVHGFDLSRKYFSQLPESFQQVILHQTNILFYYVENATNDDIEDMFYFLNSGTKLKEIERVRSVVGEKIRNSIKMVAENPFLQDSVHLNSDMKKHFAHEEVAYQCALLMMNGRKPREISLGAVKRYFMPHKADGIEQGVLDNMVGIFRYLRMAFPVKDDKLRKTHIPNIFVVASYAMEKDIDPKKFAGAVMKFFENQAQDDMEDSPYNRALMGGTNQLSSVKARIETMKEYVLRVAKTKTCPIYDPLAMNLADGKEDQSA